MNSYISKIDLETSRSKSSVLGFQDVPGNLNVNEICFEKEPDICNIHEESR